MDSASLTIVGSGIKFLSHMTAEVIAYIKAADKVLYLVNEPAMEEWIKKNNQNAESLESIYLSENLRIKAYHQIRDRILTVLRDKLHVCVVIYGHPTVLAQPAIMAVIQAREEGYDARVLPGISSVDCLFSDLLINPGSRGCHIFEASDFLIYKRNWDPSGHLILLQVGFIGAIHHPFQHDNSSGIKLLQEYLNQNYSASHECVLYEAAQYSGFQPRIEKFPLAHLGNMALNSISTLYIPPNQNVTYHFQILEKLGITESDFLNQKLE